MPGRQAWGDDDDDDYLPPRQESAVDSKGVKNIVEYHFNSNGDKVTQTRMDDRCEVLRMSYTSTDRRYIW